MGNSRTRLAGQRLVQPRVRVRRVAERPALCRKDRPTGQQLVQPRVRVRQVAELPAPRRKDRTTGKRRTKLAGPLLVQRAKRALEPPPVHRKARATQCHRIRREQPLRVPQQGSTRLSRISRRPRLWVE
jgi:hypothetical protein